MPNTTGNDRPQVTPWVTNRSLKIPAATPATSTIFYGNQAIGRNAQGNAVQCDDTAKVQFVGFLEEYIRIQVDPIDNVQINGLQGDKMFEVLQPLMFKALVPLATVGQDEGRKVYWQFNNQVSFSPGNSGNLAGQVWFVNDPTHVTVLPPWMLADLLGAPAILTLPTTGVQTLTKFDTGKTFWCAPATAQSITLPLATQCGSGDSLLFVNVGTTNIGPTLLPSGTNTINGLSSFAVSTAQWGRAIFQTDGVSQWVQVG
jgi:hypothetical protein